MATSGVYLVAPVANGFLGVKGVKRGILLNQAVKLADIQERQLTTLGQNIKALVSRGPFE